ncbi:MAG: aldo/keto reductase [Actinobacteria bacterium]|nr:aldo/keto reductase [Actinomycetota bacterium]
MRNPWPRIGVGAMPLSRTHFTGPEELAARTAVLHEAFDAGLVVVDTADVYAPDADSVGHNEAIVGEAVRTWRGQRDQLFVLTKNGLRRDGDHWWRDNSREWMLTAAQRSVESLGLVPDCIAVHRLNREQSWRECVLALVEARDRGLTASIGLSNVTAEELRSAWEFSDGSIVVVENEYSPRYRDDHAIVDFCGERGIAYLPWSPLGGGAEAAALADIYPMFGVIAAKYDTTAQVIALAWLAGLGERVIPIPGFGRIETVRASAAALNLRLTAHEQAQLSAVPAGAGSVYPD